MSLAAYASAFLVGLLGAAHCLGMCGGVVGALTAGLPPAQRGRPLAALPYQLAYNVGRIASYSLAGAAFGGLGLLSARLMPLQVAQNLLEGLAGVFMIGLGLYLGGWWQGLARLERAGGAVWRRLEPLGRRLLPIRSPTAALAVGAVWGWLPCGLVYSALVWSMSAGGPLKGALLMLSFGLGTVPTLLASGLLATRLSSLLGRASVREGAGLLVFLFGVLTLFGAMGLVPWRAMGSHYL